MEANTSYTDAGYDMYNDIKHRTNGEIYLGVVGPVRTGKSTFIRRFMELCVLPVMQDENEKKRATDELPQASGGTTIMTTEPKFIPKEAALITPFDGISVKVRMVDCVGYMIEGANGHMENGVERMVKTPWNSEEIPFSKAAETGTKKVITEHSTIGIVVTTDGSFGELKRESYIEAEQKTVDELKAIGKPFVVLLNTDKPSSAQTMALAAELSDTYGASVIPVNVEQLKESDITYIFTELLMSFPVTSIYFEIPKWLEVTSDDNEVKNSLINDAVQITGVAECLRDIDRMNYPNNEYVRKYKCSNIDMASGCVNISVDIYDNYYYEMLSDMMGADITNEYDFITELIAMADNKKYCASVIGALEQVNTRGYGLVMPDKENVQLGNPEVIKTGGKFGVKISANAPSVHLIKANITTEIMPLVGSKEQADDLVTYISDNSVDGDMWGVNIFGKTIEQLVDDGLNNKVGKIGAESQQKLQNTMEKIVNDGNGGMVCIII